ncbi:MAG: DUF1905 domain-containing protein [Actinobacteria bacterium]|uniref:Unannotated protein n=1 Tax=freshwater metagenome TaxID=449393 RepID=A0A6J7EZG6_9ZZZZ|nr:DUF1905 domain-containing protein [Actinomycetota bacterium]
MRVSFSGALWFWRGPSPWYFITVPEEQCAALEAVAPLVSYGWGMIPVTARIGDTEWTTALFPKDGRYVVPIRSSVRGSEGLSEGDDVSVRLDVTA